MSRTDQKYIKGRIKNKVKQLKDIIDEQMIIRGGKPQGWEDCMTYDHEITLTTYEMFAEIRGLIDFYEHAHPNDYDDEISELKENMIEAIKSKRDFFLTTFVQITQNSQENLNKDIKKSIMNYDPIKSLIIFVNGDSKYASSIGWSLMYVGRI